MNNLSMRKFFLFLLALSLAVGSVNAQIFHKNPEKQLFGKTHVKKKEAKVREPRKVMRAKRKQEANERRLNKAYDRSIRRSQKSKQRKKSHFKITRMLSLLITDYCFNLNKKASQFIMFRQETI